MIVGLDPSSYKLAFISGTTPDDIMQREDELGKKDSIEIRCANAYDYTYNYLFDLFTDTKEQPVVFLEKPLLAGRANVSALTVQAQVNGCVLAAARHAGAKISLVTVGTWKKTVVSNGNANKDDVTEWVVRNHGYEFGTQDLNDAFCIYLYGLAVTSAAEQIAAEVAKPKKRLIRKTK